MRISTSLPLSASLRVLALGMVLWTPGAALAEFDGERALMRQCVSDRQEDPEVVALGISEFCTCLIQEIAADADQNPDIYFPPEEPKSYYSSKEVQDLENIKQNALDGHEQFCTNLLQRPEPRQPTLDLDPISDLQTLPDTPPSSELEPIPSLQPIPQAHTW